MVPVFSQEGFGGGVPASLRNEPLSTMATTASRVFCSPSPSLPPVQQRKKWPNWPTCWGSAVSRAHLHLVTFSSGQILVPAPFSHTGDWSQVRGRPLLQRPLDRGGRCGGRGATEREAPGQWSGGTASKEKVRGRPQDRGWVQAGAAEQGLGRAGWSVNMASQGGGVSSLAPSRWARMSVTAAMSSSGSIAISWYKEPCLASAGGGFRGAGVSIFMISSQHCFHWLMSKKSCHRASIQLCRASRLSV